jgi:tetratricopeptide (TPR) repeat protein
MTAFPHDQVRRHRLVTRSPAAAVAFLVLAAVIAAVELGLVVLLRTAPRDWPVAVAVHFITCLIVAAGAWLRADDRDEQRLLQLLAASLPFFGPVAPVMLLLVYPVYLRFRATATPFDDWYRTLFPEAERPLSAQIYQSIMRNEVPRGDYSPVVSYMDVMRDGPVQQRIAVVASVARNFRPVFAPVLNAAIADDNPEVRVQAASAVAKLTDDFVGRVQALEAAVAAAPHESKRLRDLAQAYDEYAYTGILDAAMEQNNRLRALQLWIAYCEMEPKDRDAALAVGRLLMRLERYHLAAQWLESAFTEGRASRQAVLWYMEVLYELGRTDVLRRIAGQAVTDLAQDRKLSSNAVSAVQLWASGAVSGPREAEAGA